MRYAQGKAGEKLHLVYEAGEGPDPQHLTPAGTVSQPICGKKVERYRMTINVSLGEECKNCRRVLDTMNRDIRIQIEIQRGSVAEGNDGE
jgi:hypothetical protein